MFGAWQPPTHSVISQQVQPNPTISRQIHATLIQHPMIQPSLCQILCYDTLDIAISKLWLSLQPIPYVLQLIQQSHMIQQAIKSPFSYWYNKLVRPYTTIDTARLRNVTTLPSIQQANYYYVTITINTTSHYVSILLLYITQYAKILLLTQQATRIQQSYVTILQLIQTILILYPSGYNNLLRYHIPIDTASYYVPIPLLILQAIMLLYYHWYLIQQPSLLIYNHWFSKLPYNLMILWYKT